MAIASNATTFAVGDGRGVTGLEFGVSLSRPKWQRYMSWQGDLEQGGVVVGNEVFITVDAEALLEDG